MTLDDKFRWISVQDETNLRGLARRLFASWLCFVEETGGPRVFIT